MPPPIGMPRGVKRRARRACEVHQVFQSTSLLDLDHGTSMSSLDSGFACFSKTKFSAVGKALLSFLFKSKVSSLCGLLYVVAPHIFYIAIRFLFLGGEGALQTSRGGAFFMLWLSLLCSLSLVIAFSFVFCFSTEPLLLCQHQEKTRNKKHGWAYKSPSSSSKC